MDLELRNVGSDDYPSYIRMLVAGVSGVGKTTFGTTFPAPLFVNAAGGMSALVGQPLNHYVNAHTEADLFRVKIALDRPAEEREKLFGFPVDTLVIDTIDELQRIMMLDRMKAEGRTEIKVDDWSWIAQRLNAIFEGLAQLPLNLLVLSHLKDVDYGTHVIQKPALGGAFSEQIHNYVDFSLIMHAGPEVIADSAITNLEIDPGTGSGEVVLTGEVPVRRTWLVTAPTEIAEWVHTRVGTFPKIVEPDYQVFHEAIRDTAVQLSEVQVVSFDPWEEEEEEPSQEEGQQLSILDIPNEDSEITCEECKGTIDSKTWIDLSMMKFDQALCGPCFKSRQ